MSILLRPWVRLTFEKEGLIGEVRALVRPYSVQVRPH